MKRTIHKALKKHISFVPNVSMHHASIRPVLEHDSPRTSTDNALLRGHDLSQMPVRSVELTGAHRNLNPPCAYTPQRCPSGGACHLCPRRVPAAH